MDNRGLLPLLELYKTPTENAKNRKEKKNDFLFPTDTSWTKSNIPITELIQTHRTTMFNQT